MDIINTIFAILSFGIAIIGVFILLKYPSQYDLFESGSSFWRVVVGLCFIVLGLIIAWSFLAFIFDLSGTETSLRIVAVINLLLFIVIGISLITGQPILKRLHSSLSKRQQLFLGISIIAFGLGMAFSFSGIRDYLNLTSNQEAAVFGGLLAITFIPLLLFTIVRFGENARQ